MSVLDQVRDKGTVGAYRTGAFLARLLPERIAQALPRSVGPALAKMAPTKAAMLRRHLQRANPNYAGRELDAAVSGGFESYARYYMESFRLPGRSDADLDSGIEVPDFHHISDALAQGNGCILALPHLGGWEWAGFWLTTVKGLPTTVVVEQLDPPELFDWFANLRQEFGMKIIVADSNAGVEVAAALSRNEIVCLLCDRDVMGGGVDVEFFGETTKLPAGPAMLGLRKGTPVLPVGVYFRPDGTHLGVVRPPLDLERKGKFRADVAAGTQLLANELEGLIERAPDQWHLLQPNWPSDTSSSSATQSR
ncbi:MAG: phosphatidylinositol mannoside acyltransferase [Actinobacteria bacterium]|nr:phosphatidylinositol mannoside acyltransferase [Actinomycetota bacterium]